jgi:L-amino acid N-acyltransferase YncA
MSVAITIRDATETDLPAILAIHNEAVLHGTSIWSTVPVDLDNRRAVLADRRAKGYAFLVADEGGTVLGYASFGDFRPHDGYYKTVEHSVYVHPDHQRRGVASRLMGPLIEAARGCGKHVMIGGIDATNAPSIRFHEGFGFVETGRLPAVGFKFGRYLDLVFMQKMLD